MKKTVLILVSSIFFASCDKRYDDDFFTVNKCNEDILVAVTFVNGEKTANFKITPQKDTLIHSVWWVSQKPNLIGTVFIDINVSKNGIFVKKNCMDKNNWHNVDIDATHRKWYLTIYPEDFE